MKTRVVDGETFGSLDNGKTWEPTVNFTVVETWTVECPYCPNEQDAPFNEENPMSPMMQFCDTCGEKFILTYERD